MGIDIRDSPRQIECVHCGECIDACDEVLGRLGKDGLIHYAWGPGPVRSSAPPAWYRKIGLLDARRVVLFLVLLGYGFGLWITVAMRSPLLVRVSPDRSTLFTVGADGGVVNRFRITVANRADRDARLALRVTGLPRSRLTAGLDSLMVGAGGQLTRDFELTAWNAPPGVTPIRFVARWTPEDGEREYPMTFISPERSQTP